MFNLDPTKILIIVTVALVVLGPDKLPSAIRTVGKYWNEINRVRNRIRDEMNGALSTITDQIAPVRSAVEDAFGEIRDPFDIVTSAFTSSSAPVQGPSKEHAAQMFGSNRDLESRESDGDRLESVHRQPFGGQNLRVSPNADVFWN
ncbi:MAG: twin-arginine translocase TatA/TatE family subunit [Actinomycetota bacterium]|nr:twin-arginine translocase TatA/TatE family subunit [Actinomycetota bacterium]